MLRWGRWVDRAVGCSGPVMGRWIGAVDRDDGFCGGSRWHDNGGFIHGIKLFIKAETMKRLVIMLLGVFLGTAAMAQAGPGKSTQKERDKTMKNLREDVRAHEDTKHVVGDDLVHFRIRRAIQEHREVARTHKMVDKDRKIARRQGIDHPVAVARRQVHHEEDRNRS